MLPLLIDVLLKNIPLKLLIDILAYPIFESINPISNKTFSIKLHPVSLQLLNSHLIKLQLSNVVFEKLQLLNSTSVKEVFSNLLFIIETLLNIALLQVTSKTSRLLVE